MMNFTQADRERGLEKMRPENLSAAARVRKAFKSGRPKRDRLHNAYSAVGEMVSHFEKLREMQTEAGLDPEDVHVAMVWQGTDVDNLNKVFTRWLLTPDRVPLMVERILQFKDAKILGLIFSQEDREAPAPSGNAWIFPFLSDDASAEALIKACRNFTAGGQQRVEN
jgi:hypothetical protein